MQRVMDFGISKAIFAGVPFARNKAIFCVCLFHFFTNNRTHMASIDAFRAPSLVSKETKQELQQSSQMEDYDVATAAATQQEDTAMDEDQPKKPSFAPASKAETNVNH